MKSTYSERKISNFRMKTLVIAAITLNGFLAHEETENSLWTSKEDKRFFKQITLSLAGPIIMGRKTYETIPQGLPGRELYVFTHSPAKYTEQKSIHFVSKPAGCLLKELQEKQYEYCWIAGGRTIYTLFLKNGWVDELYLTLEPVLFYKGIPWVEALEFDVPFFLLEARKLSDNTLMLHYKK